MSRFANISLKKILMVLGTVLLLGSSWLLQAEDESAGLSDKQRQALETLQNLVSLQENLKQDIEELSKQITKAKSDSQKQSLSESLAKLESDLDATEKNLENISAGIDLSALRDEEETKFDIQEELFGLLKPAIDEMKDMTSHIRQKSDLKERIAYYDERLKVIESALGNANNLLQQSESEDIKASLSGMATDWEKKRAFMQSELESAQLQLDELLASEASITEASQSYLKSFFQKRGLYLIEALAVVLLIVLLSRFSLNLMRRYMPGFKKKHRSFRTRLLELIHRIVTIFLVIMGPMVVFYVVEDWVLFSLSILLLLGIAWTLRQALPRYWHQIQLFLNIGSGAGR